MQIKKWLWAMALFSLTVFILAGCTVRTYSLTRDRVDQNLSAGNRGYLAGSAPAVSGERKARRTTQVIEIEFGKEVKIEKRAPQIESVSAPEVIAAESRIGKAQPVSEVATKMQEYKVKEKDTLQKISLSFYGTTKKWTKIYEANKDKLSGPNKIYPGQVLYIPLEELKEPAENLK